MSNEVVVEFDLDGITIGEVVLIEEWARGDVPTREVVEALQARVTNAVELMGLPWFQMDGILRTIRAYIFGKQGNSSSG